MNTKGQRFFLDFTVNGEPRSVPIKAHDTLVRVLREGLGLTGAKESCGIGECGACTVLLDGKPVNSCLILAAAVEGKSVTTIEGLAKADGLHPVQQAFVDQAGIQCGFCTPGMILTTAALLQEHPNPTPEQIRHALAGNICRCTGYMSILRAVQDAAARLRGSP